MTTDIENSYYTIPLLWMERPRSTCPMSARSYAVEIMEDLKIAGVEVPLVSKQGFTIQDIITSIVEDAMDQQAYEIVPSKPRRKWWDKWLSRS